MPRKMTIEERETAINKGTRQNAKLGQQIKSVQQEMKADKNLAAMYSRKERTHRLCTQGAMLESFLQSPDLLSDDQVMSLLHVAFGQEETRNALTAELAKTEPVT